MTQPSTPNGNPPRARNRGAIRTHLGRKRVSPRNRAPGDATRAMDTRREQEHLFDKMLVRVQALFGEAGERTAEALDAAIDTALSTIATAGEFASENAERLRNDLRRDVLHRDHPAMTFRTGEITTAGTLSCTRCGWTITNTRTSVLPPCPQCGETTFRKTG
jgi:hypothetical protein